MDITIRPATADDIEHVIAILLDDPPPDVRALVPDERKTRSVGALLARHGLLVGLDETVLAIADERPVGLMETLRSKSHRPTGAREIAEILIQSTRLAGPGVIARYVRLVRARSRMAIKCPAGEFDLIELDVHREYRNRGIGSQLLDHAERAARGGQFTRMWLTTEISNPARRLYERSGYHVVRAATDAVYERMTGAPGRILMMKELT